MVPKTQDEFHHFCFFFAFDGEKGLRNRGNILSDSKVLIYLLRF